MNAGLLQRLCDRDELVLVGWDAMLTQFDFEQMYRLMDNWAHVAINATSFIECTEWLLYDLRTMMDEFKLKYKDNLYKFSTPMPDSSDEDENQPGGNGASGQDGPNGLGGDGNQDGDEHKPNQGVDEVNQDKSGGQDKSVEQVDEHSS